MKKKQGKMGKMADYFVTKGQNSVTKRCKKC